MDTKKPTAAAQGAPVAVAQARPYTGGEPPALVRPPMTSHPKKPEQSSPTPARALTEAPVPQDGLGLWLYSALDSQRLEAREERRDMEGRLNERFWELGGKVSSVDRRLSAVERQGAAVEGRLSAVETGLAEHRAETREEFKAVNATLSELCARLDRMEAASAAEKEQRDRRWRVIAWLVPALIGIFGVGLAVFGHFLLQRLAG